ncbi:MAG: hypothetical protein ABW089_12805, partial [Sedimenticola sp.]
MAHFPVRHPFGAPLGAASKMLPAFFIEPKGSNQGLRSPENKKPAIKAGSFVFGGEGGIRTLDTLLTYTHFPGVLLQPLGHL